MVGDILFFKKTKSWISKVIARLTNGEYTHVGLIVAYDDTTHTATIIEANRFIETRIATIVIDDNYAIFSTGAKADSQRDMIVKYAYDSLGGKYDYLHILGLSISLIFKRERYSFFNIKNRIICSEMIDLSYYKAGVKRTNNLNIGDITPQELIELYDLKEIRKGA